MLRNKIYLVLLLFSILPLNAMANNVNQLFDAANKSYESGDYKSAFVWYDSIEKIGYQSPELFLNKGNAAYKLDNLPEAIYCFEKALKLKPNFDDAQHNISVVNALLVDKQPKTNSKGVLTWLFGIIGANYNFFGWIGVVLVILLSVLIVSNTLLEKALIKKVTPILSILFITSIIISFLFASLQKSHLTTVNSAIIYQPVVEIMNEPSSNSSVAFSLHEGSKVALIEKTDSWAKINFDNKVGWVSIDSIKEI
jgi:tetratricopeptide (TPR) repeat protein